MIALHSAYAASLLPAWRRFARAADDPARAQREQLSAVLASAAPSAYGRSLGLSQTSSVAEYRRLAPVVDHGPLAPLVARVAAGEPGVLTVEPVRMLERTSGTTSANKLIPYTDGLRHDFAAAVDAWLFDLHRAFPRLVGTRSYWSVSPATRRGERGADDEGFGAHHGVASGRLAYAGWCCGMPCCNRCCVVLPAVVLGGVVLADVELADVVPLMIGAAGAEPG